jgi:hypothetical protein
VLTLATAEQACARLSASRRYLAVPLENAAVIYDLKATSGHFFREIARFDVSDLFFLGDGPSFMAVNNETRMLGRWMVPSPESQDTRWRHQEITNAFFSGEPDRSGDRIIAVEDLGRNNAGIVLYSLVADRTYRRLVACYRHAEAHFARNGDVIFSGCEQPTRAFTPHRLPDAVARARTELSERCLAFSGERYQQSPCWPID